LKIVPGVHRLGGDSQVNSYLIDDGGEVTIIDAAMPGFYDDIPRELAAMGRRIEDVRALVLTHGHTDHIGFAERLRVERHVPVWIEELDVALARGEATVQRPWGKISLAPLLGFLWLAMRHGGLRRPVVHELSTFGDGAILDVPGSPRVTLVPGHTPGSAALEVTTLNALFVGDAFCTYAVTSGRHGPQIAPFSADPAQARQSLSLLAGSSAGLVLPGHGDPWTGGMAEALKLIEAGETAR